jgi:formylglycine-generating enzyme
MNRTRTIALLATSLGVVTLAIGAVAVRHGPLRSTQGAGATWSSASAQYSSTPSLKAPSDPRIAASLQPVLSEPTQEAANNVFASIPACPQDMALVEGQHCYYLDQPCKRWDDPEGQPDRRVCAEFDKPSTCTSRRHAMRFCIDRDEFVHAGEKLPATNTSWTQADLMCASLGKRLCTSLEWEFACEGEDGLPYPYGYERSAGLCNQDRLLSDGKNRANADLREAGHSTCVSPFGVRDMVGNVDEWVRRPYAKPGRRSELRGGWWMTGRNRCRAMTSHHDEKYSGMQTGFRCCADAAGTDRAAARTDRTIAARSIQP